MANGKAANAEQKALGKRKRGEKAAATAAAEPAVPERVIGISIPTKMADRVLAAIESHAAVGICSGVSQIDGSGGTAAGGVIDLSAY